MERTKSEERERERQGKELCDQFLPRFSLCAQNPSLLLRFSGLATETEKRPEKMGWLPLMPRRNSDTKTKSFGEGEGERERERGREREERERVGKERGPPPGSNRLIKGLCL